MFGGIGRLGYQVPQRDLQLNKLLIVDEESIRGHEGVGAAAKYRLLYMYDER
jgi:hypothetical protein